MNPRPLEELSLEELWQLFPIYLVSHNPKWKDWASDETASLHKLLVSFSPVINHIGSTAIPSICAKPVIDILVELPPETSLPLIRCIMENNGYICMSESGKRMSFNKGYTPEGYAEKVFHIHFHPIGDRDEIFFRDFLIANPEVAREYEALKLSLATRFRNNRDGYTQAKSGFVASVMKHQ